MMCYWIIYFGYSLLITSFFSIVATQSFFLYASSANQLNQSLDFMNFKSSSKFTSFYSENSCSLTISIKVKILSLDSLIFISLIFYLEILICSNLLFYSFSGTALLQNIFLVQSQILPSLFPKQLQNLWNSHKLYCHSSRKSIKKIIIDFVNIILTMFKQDLERMILRVIIRH